MNKLLLIIALTALAVGCSKEAETEAPTETSVIDDVSQPEVEAVAEETPAVTTESLEVVEESAAEAEPEDKAIMLAQAEDPETAVARTWQFREGANYTRMVPTQPTVGGADKIEVAEVFMYSCPHCYDLETFIHQWEQSKDPNVRLVRIPAVFNQIARLHAQLYYTEEFLDRAGKFEDRNAFRNMVFEEFHRRGNRLTSEDAIQRLFVKAGISEADFQRTWGSFEVNQALRVAQDLARRYGITSVPTIIVNGKYRTDAGSAGSYPKLIELIDELTVREGLR